jgi:hypothetical protein
VMQAMFVVVIAAALPAAWSQVVRYGRASSDERHQIKWFAAAALFLAVAYSLVVILYVGTGEDDNYAAGRIIQSVVLFGLISVPLATGVAILRYRLYDIDILISGTLVYVPLTAILAGVYIALTGVFRAVLTGSVSGKSESAVAFTTIIVVAMLTPVKNYLQEQVDRRFKERRAPAHELEALMRRARDVIDVLDTKAFATRFVETAASAMGADGAKLILGVDEGDDSSFGVVSKAAVEIPLLMDGRYAGCLLLGPRSGGRVYTPREKEALEQSAQTVVLLLGLEAPMRRVQEQEVAL